MEEEKEYFNARNWALLDIEYIQKGDKTDLVTESGRFFKQNIYL